MEKKALGRGLGALKSVAAIHSPSMKPSALPVPEEKTFALADIDWARSHRHADGGHPTIQTSQRVWWQAVVRRVLYRALSSP